FYGLIFFFFDISAVTEIYTLSLHDALPILFPCQRPITTAMGCSMFISAHIGLPLPSEPAPPAVSPRSKKVILIGRMSSSPLRWRSEEHTSELQSRGHLVCRLLLEKKNITNI